VSARAPTTERSPRRASAAAKPRRAMPAGRPPGGRAVPGNATLASHAPPEATPSQSRPQRSEPADTPGLVVLAADGTLLSTTAAGERWLQELGQPEPERRGLPSEVSALAAGLRRPGADAESPRLGVQTRAGGWAVLHAARLSAPGGGAIAVIIEAASPAELAPLLTLAYGLTGRERALTALACRGLSTREIAAELYISPYTVQDHLKSIFDKTGVRSRRELVSAILREQDRPADFPGGGGSPGGRAHAPAPTVPEQVGAAPGRPTL
jgi:DNA-binding CsgD family transcriptional regulator